MHRDLAVGLAATALTALAASAVLARIAAGTAGELDLLVTAGLFVTAWIAMQRLAPLPRAGRIVPVLFGGWLLFLWEAGTRGFGVPAVLLPPPSAVAGALVATAPILAQDFVQTVLREVLPGWALGCAAGFLTALLIDRLPFLQRGLVPVGNLVAALPIVGIAPIMVMWFGFDWPSKVAVVVVMTFFPMLVSTRAGLETAGRLERDLLRTYAASYPQTLVKLRLPAALPFIFNALKLNSTLALIGAIVAEFFGTPIVGMGFRISTEVGRMNLDVVWATIVTAAVTGSLFYGLLALLERMLTFWHASYRGRDVLA